MQNFKSSNFVLDLLNFFCQSSYFCWEACGSAVRNGIIVVWEGRWLKV